VVGNNFSKGIKMTAQLDMTTHFDAIVVGAGFAGITAARELHAQGRRTLLLEARDRIGGRAYTESFAGELIELGGAWVHWTQPHVWAELTRYQLELVADAQAEFATFPGPDGMRSYPADDILPRQQELLTKLFEGSDEYFELPYQPLYRADELAAVDKFSLRDRISALNLSPADEGLLSGWASGESGGLASRGALTMPAQWWALGGLEHHGFDAIFRMRLVAGMRALAAAMLADADADLRLSSPVAAIHDDGTQVHVTTRAGERFTAPAAVVAVPVNVWRTIDFSPQLSAVHVDASTVGVGVPYGTKLAIHLRGDFGPFYAQGEEGDPFIGLFPHRVLDDGQLVVGFCVEEDVDVTDRAQVEAAVRHLEPRAEVVDYRYHDWGRDEFSCGGWAYRQPGQLSGQLAAIQEPQGRLAFATGDIASGWCGCIDGAIESGIIAGRHVAGSTEKSVLAR
jgi:monoamine oxidase